MYRYTVIIADDEIANVNGVSALLARECPEVVVVAKFNNGLDAIEYLKTNHVDIAILDIKMPLADGLDVAEYIYENSLETSTVIMTGYREFEYTKRAINAQVTAFLEKPLDLKLAVAKIHEICREKEEKAKEQIILSGRLLEQNNKFNQDLKLFYFGEYSFETLKSGYGDKYPLDKKCAVITFCIDGNERYDERFWKDIAQIENEKIAAFLLAAYDSSARFLFMAMEGDIELFAGKYCDEMKPLFEYSPQSVCDYTIEWHNSVKTINKSKSSETANLLLESLIFRNTKDTDILNDIISYYSPNLLLDFITVFLDKISENMDIDRNYYLEKAKGSNNSEKLLSIVNEIENFFIENISQNDDMIEEIKKYLKDNCEKNISLKSVADKFSFNYSYLSRLFKEKIGMNFSDYLVFVRIEKAKELLKAGKHKIDDVAMMVGYNKYSYFRELFKRQTGLTPSQYIAIRRLKNGEE